MTIRHVLAAALTALLFYGVGVAGPATRPAAPPNATEALRRQLPKVELANVSLEDALKSLAKQVNVTLVPNWRDLQAAGVKRDAKISLAAANITGADAVRQILAAAGAAAHYSVEHNVVYVATNKELARHAFAVGRAAGDPKANKATAALLAHLGPAKVKIDAVSLSDALDFCRDKLKVPLEVDWDALGRIGLTRDMRVSVDLHGLCVGDMIYWILRPLPAKGTIEWSTRNGKFVITAAPPPKPVSAVRS